MPPSKPNPTDTTVAITGASGLVGGALTSHLESAGFGVRPLVRREAKEGEIRWSPSDQTIDADALADVDAVIHLAGESLIGIRWTEEKKRKIFDSRVDGTRLIAETIADLKEGPQVLLSASGIDYYGDTGDDPVDESTEGGEGFLAEVCAAWEGATKPATDAGLRVVNTRFALILSGTGGALSKMLPAFRMGVAGPIGDGSQYFPWVSLSDVVAIMEHLLRSDLHGPVNVVSPQPVTNLEFTKTLGEVLSRPTFMKVPDFAVKAAFGEMGQQTLLTGQRARPTKLLDDGYEFLFAELENALRHELERD